MNSSLRNKAVEVLGEKWSYWVEKKESFFSWAIDSIGCLGFLHGKSGTFQAKTATPGWLFPLFDGHPEVTSLNWEAGKAEVTRNGKIVEMRLGKLLRSVNATPEQLHEFETRELATWEWKTSASLWDLLTMSHRRAWTSCMRPGQCYENGPFSEMRAGSALLFWFRPGADEPCSREILRPCIWQGKAAVLRGGRLYGDGPASVNTQDLEQMLQSPIPFIDGGSNGLNILVNGYIDEDSSGYELSPEQEKKVEKDLIEAFSSLLSKGIHAYQEVEPLIASATTKNNPPKKNRWWLASDLLDRWLSSEYQRLERAFFQARAKLSQEENTLRHSRPAGFFFFDEEAKRFRIDYSDWQRPENDPRRPILEARVQIAKRKLSEIEAELYAAKELRLVYQEESN